MPHPSLGEIIPRDVPFEIGTKPVKRDSAGWLIVHSSYEGWAPKEREFSSWWLVLGAVLAVFVSIRGMA